MIRGLYNGAAAMDVLARQQELISSNLANVNTSGFRASRASVSQRNIEPSLGSFNELGPEISEVRLEFSNGRLQRTDRPLDVSLVGDGFLEFETPEGLLYSRAGQLYRNPETGDLTNGDGYIVQGSNGGSISIPNEISDRDIVIGSDGTISANGEQLGQFSLVSFDDNKKLKSVSQSFFGIGQAVKQPETDASLLQFHQEFSNVNAISEMVAMIVGTRQYEAVQKVSQALSESLREHIRA